MTEYRVRQLIEEALAPVKSKERDRQLESWHGNVCVNNENQHRLKERFGTYRPLPKGLRDRADIAELVHRGYFEEGRVGKGKRFLADRGDR